MAARRHHYVPQFYLRGFARDREKPSLFVFDLKDRRAFCASPKDVAVEQDFHRVDAPGQPIDAAERGFAQIEEQIAPSLRRVLEARSLTNEDDRAMIFTLLCLLLLKNPRMRENVRASFENMAKATYASIAADPEIFDAEMSRAKTEGVIDNDADVEAMRRSILNDEFRYGLSVPAHMGIELTMLQRIVPYVAHRKWRLLKAGVDSSGFICSDTPVCLTWQASPDRRDSPGLGVPGTSIIFPLATHLAMIGAFEFDEEEIEANERAVAAVNREVIDHANRQVYARDGDFVFVAPDRQSLMRGFDLSQAFEG